MNIAPQHIFDREGIAELRREVGAGSVEGAEETARQFEALFLQMMLKAMRETVGEGGLFDSDQGKFYQELQDEQMAMDLARNGGLGLADLLARQLLSAQSEAEPAADLEGSLLPQNSAPTLQNGPAKAAVEAYRQAIEVISDSSVATRVEPVKSEVGAQTAVVLDHPGNPVEFVTQLYPAAAKAAARIGVAPELILAQAALETGWGGVMITDQSGENSHNLFGIKADGRWSGESVEVSTLEYVAGFAQRQQASFRVYDSYSESFEDYVDFLQQNPRYQTVLESAGDTRRFAQELQAAGYATDPEYADKINGVLEGASMRRALAELKAA